MSPCGYNGTPLGSALMYGAGISTATNTSPFIRGYSALTENETERKFVIMQT